MVKTNHQSASLPLYHLSQWGATHPGSRAGKSIIEAMSSILTTTL